MTEDSHSPRSFFSLFIVAMRLVVAYDRSDLIGCKYVTPPLVTSPRLVIRLQDGREHTLDTVHGKRRHQAHVCPTRLFPGRIIFQCNT